MFCELGPVALAVRAACPLRGCVRALPRRPRPPHPFALLRAHFATSPGKPPVGLLQVVRAPPRFPPGSLALTA